MRLRFTVSLAFALCSVMATAHTVDPDYEGLPYGLKYFMSKQTAVERMTHIGLYRLVADGGRLVRFVSVPSGVRPHIVALLEFNDAGLTRVSLSAPGMNRSQYERVIQNLITGATYLKSGGGPLVTVVEDPDKSRYEFEWHSYEGKLLSFYCFGGSADSKAKGKFKTSETHSKFRPCVLEE